MRKKKIQRKGNKETTEAYIGKEKYKLDSVTFL